jgi:hypothetical protein
MSKEFSAYKELVLDRNREGGTWIARIYKRKGPATMLAESSGVETDYETAKEVATEWADAQLEKYRVTPLQVVSSDDIDDDEAPTKIFGILKI